MNASSGEGKAGARSSAPRIESRDLPRNWVPRPRLTELLDRAVTRPLTLIVAPAGSGKSVALRGWVAHAPTGPRGSVRWVNARHRLGEDESTSLAQALSDVGLRGRGAGPDFVIVDDAHLLNQAELRQVAAALDARSESLRLILATRRDLSLPLVRLELSDALTEIRADQLLFRDDEAEALITAHAPDASDLDVSTVRERGRGWAAALVLGARAIGGAADRVAARHALAVTEQPILDYLLGEVFDTLDARTCHVLLCTCAADTVSGADAVTMSADPDAVALLSRLAMEGMLVSAEDSADGADSADGIDSDDEWPTSFTYHPLLVELLRRRVTTGAAEHALYAAAQVRIVRHYLAQGDPVRAMHFATRLDDRLWVAQLLCEHGVGLLMLGQRALVARTLDVLPDDLQKAFPALIAVRALERRAARDIPAATTLAREAVRIADRLESEIGDGSTTTPRSDPISTAEKCLLDTALILRCWLSRSGGAGSDDAVRLARRRLGCEAGERAEHQHATGFRTDADADSTRCWLLAELSVCETWLGDLESARTHIDASLAIARTLGGEVLVARGLAHLSIIEWATGRDNAAALHAQEAVLTAEVSGAWPEAFVARARIVLAWLAMQQLHFDVAESELAAALAHQAHDHDRIVQVMGQLIRGYLLIHAGEIGAARELLDATTPTGEAFPAFIEIRRTVLGAWCALAANDVEGIEEEIPRLQALDEDAHAELVRAVAADLRGDTDEALAMLADVTGGPTPADRSRVPRVAASAYRTWILLRRGERDAARTQLRDVLNHITANQRLFVSGVATMPEMVELLEDEAASAAPHPAAAEQLAALLAFQRSWQRQADTGTRLTAGPEPATDLRAERPGAAPDDPRDGAELSIDLRERAASAPFVAALTSREQDVLRELALGGSYADIAAVLYITENTVKTHLASLYRKLGASRRADALRAARTAGLLKP